HRVVKQTWSDHNPVRVAISSN
ncbi:MAG: hypothetical protein RL753_814, partial [Bacteroidota bacterium]